MAKTDFKTIDQYHSTFTPDIVERMQSIRAIIHKIVPGVEEAISYQIPCFKYKGYLIYYAGFTNHVTLSNPFSPELLAHFKDEFKKYKVSRAAIQFPHKDPLPVKLITAIIKFRKAENDQKVLAESKKGKK
jgi:uncharacterized protein YdhG (YjbR/CyaY superfamily)